MNTGEGKERENSAPHLVISVWVLEKETSADEDAGLVF